MRIVFGTDVFYPLLEGGGEVATFNVARHLARWGHSVTVLAGKTSQFPRDTLTRLRTLKNEEIVSGMRIIRSPYAYRFGSTFASLPALWDMFLRLRALAANGGVDVVNFVLYRPCLPFLFGARLAPRVLTVHLTSEGFRDYRGWLDYDAGLLGGMAQRIAEEGFLRVPYAGIITVSEWQRALLQERLGKRPIDVVYNGVDLELFDRVQAGPRKPYQVIFLSALTARKNVADAIRAVARARRHFPQLHLVIVSHGGDQEGLVRRECERKEFISYVRQPSHEEKIRLLKESALLLFPSRMEGFPLVPLEALSCGTPFVGYDIPAVSEVACLTGGAILAPYGDPDALAGAICDVVGDEGGRERLAAQGRQAVEERFTWEAVARRVEGVFQRVARPAGNTR